MRVWRSEVLAPREIEETNDFMRHWYEANPDSNTRHTMRDTLRGYDIEQDIRQDRGNFRDTKEQQEELDRELDQALGASRLFAPQVDSWVPNKDQDFEQRQQEELDPAADDLLRSDSPR
jgi:hypothetical protein